MLIGDLSSWGSRETRPAARLLCSDSLSARRPASGKTCAGSLSPLDETPGQSGLVTVLVGSGESR
jgi:hypothetical protein